MIIGDGDLASVLPESNGFLYFASGVSNSQCTDEKEYDKEIDLLLKQDKHAHIVYFSTLAIYYSDTRYVLHKWQMESLVKEYFPRYTIIRLGNITWGKNPNTLINYLKAHPKAKIKDEYRYICDKDEFLHWINLIPSWPDTMNITGKRLKVKEIKELYCAE